MSTGLIIRQVNPERESIVLQAREALDLSDYLVYDATFSDEDLPSNKGRHVFRFPSHQLEKGDWIVLKIGPGPRKGKPMTFEDGDPGHRFYWDRKAPIVNNTGDQLTLIQIAGQQIFTVPAVKK